jgi:hypothetical protein
VLKHSNQPPVELKANGLVVLAQVYQPGLLISEFHGPLAIGEPGKSPDIVADWKLAQSKRAWYAGGAGRASLVFDQPVIDRINGDTRQNLLRAKHIEVHGRMAEGSASDKPVIEIALQLDQASAATLHPAAVQPIDANVTGVLRGLNDFSPKPWSVRFREMQAAGGRIDITQARVQQGEILAVAGTLSLNVNGRLRANCASRWLVSTSSWSQSAPSSGCRLAKHASCWRADRLAPGLGDVARQQAGANISLGINLLASRPHLKASVVTLPLVAMARFLDRSRRERASVILALFRRVRLGQGLVRQVRMRPTSPAWTHLADIDDAFTDGPGALEVFKQCVAVALADASLAETSSLKRPSISKTVLVGEETSRHMIDRMRRCE